MLDDADYTVPLDQCCIDVDFGRYTYRWCSIKECYDSEEDCFHSCQNNHRLATSPISKLDSNTRSSGNDSLGISREGANTTSM